MSSNTTLAGRRRPALMIGEFTVKGRALGKGGMGTVYPVEDARGCRYAIKEFSPTLIRDRKLKARFKQEHEILSDLKHPNIVRVGKLIEANHTLNMQMELLEGLDLKQILRKKKFLEPLLAYAIGSRVASALGYAHKKGILHRDIKPENVVITITGQVKLTDFGVARLGDGGLTIAGSVVGTPDYISPQQLTGDPRLTPAADVFSLGVVLYQILEGKLPFPRMRKASLVQMAESRATKTPRFPARVPDEDVARAIMACLDPDASKRPNSTKELELILLNKEDAMAEKNLADLVCEIKNRRRQDSSDPALISLPTPRARRAVETSLGMVFVTVVGWVAIGWLLGDGGLTELVQWFWGLIQAVGWGLVSR